MRDIDNETGNARVLIAIYPMSQLAQEAICKLTNNTKSLVKRKRFWSELSTLLNSKQKTVYLTRCRLISITKIAFSVFVVNDIDSLKMTQLAQYELFQLC